MAKQTLDTLKGWAVRGWKPMAAQIKDWLDSYWHKDDKIPISSVKDLERLLNELPKPGGGVDVLTGSIEIVYKLEPGLLLQTLCIRVKEPAVVRAGTTSGGDEVMPDVNIEPGVPHVLNHLVEADDIYLLYVSGLPPDSIIKFYKA